MTNVVRFPVSRSVEKLISEAFEAGTTSATVARQVTELSPATSRRTAKAIVRTEMTRLASREAEARYRAML